MTDVISNVQDLALPATGGRSALPGSHDFIRHPPPVKPAILRANTFPIDQALGVRGIQRDMIAERFITIERHVVRPRRTLQSDVTSDQRPVPRRTLPFTVRRPGRGHERRPQGVGEWQIERWWTGGLEQTQRHSGAKDFNAAHTHDYLTRIGNDTRRTGVVPHRLLSLACRECKRRARLSGPRPEGRSAAKSIVHGEANYSPR